VLVYGIIFSAGIYYINRLLAKGLDTDAPAAPSSQAPITAAPQAGHQAVRGG
jgi:hypothetical protein